MNIIMHLLSGHALALHEGVELFVFVAVVRLLADEPFHPLAQIRVGDLFLVVAHRAHEEALAFREGTGQRGQQDGLELVAGEPVARHVRVELEIHAPGLNVAAVGAARLVRGNRGFGVHSNHLPCCGDRRLSGDAREP